MRGPTRIYTMSYYNVTKGDKMEQHIGVMDFSTTLSFKVRCARCGYEWTYTPRKPERIEQILKMLDERGYAICRMACPTCGRINAPVVKLDDVDEQKEVNENAE